KPYPGQNKLPDRLLAIKEFNEKYQKLLKDLSTTVFTKEELVKEASASEKLTKEILEKEAKAVAARKEPAPRLGGPGGMGPQAPDLKTFAEKRPESVADQLAGKSKGYAPHQFGFGPPPGGMGGGFGPPGGGNQQPITEQQFRTEVTVPPEFEA